MQSLKQIFKTDRPLIGMIHFPPLIGQKDYPGFNFIKQKTLKEVRILENGGVNGIMIENNYDIPHFEKIDSMKAAMLGSLAELISKTTRLPLGINVLWNDYRIALAICASTRLSFFRVPAFVDTVKTDYGIMKARAKEVMALRKLLKLEHVAILADIQVKHSQMVDKKKSLTQSAKEAVKSGADVIIVTGKWTGDAPKIEDLKEARMAIGNFPILIGSGATTDNLPTLLKYADGIIVGTALKEGEVKSRKEEVNLKPFEYLINFQKTKSFVQKFVRSIKI